MEDIRIVSVTPDHVEEYGIYCIRDKSAPGYEAKVNWLCNKQNSGVMLKMAIDGNGKQLGFIETLPSEKAWRPLLAKDLMYIQCIAIFGKDARNKSVGSKLVEACEEEAVKQKRKGLCTITSKGAWMADSSLFEKKGFIKSDEYDRFELMFKPFSAKTAQPSLIRWDQELKKYKGWNLIYADQCPWHYKSVTDLTEVAQGLGIKLKVKKLTSPEEAQQAPSGFGTFSLIKNGVLLADHYISATRFKNIIRQVGV